MRDGFIRVAAASPKLRVADCAFNTKKIIEAIRTAAASGVSLLVLPELCVTGYTCGDLFLQSALLQSALRSLAELAAETRGKNLLVFVGLPLEKDQKLYNCAAALFDGEVLGVVPKSHLPNYGEFYELRNFAPAPAANMQIALGGKNVPFGPRLLFECRTLPDLKIGAEICEDLWVAAPPSILHARAGATVVCNLSASDETVGKSDYRRSLAACQSAKLLCAYLYADANEGESTTDMVFAAHNLICENGALLAESRPFGRGWAETEIDVAYLAAERRRMTSHVPEAEGYETVGFSLELRTTPLSRSFSREPFIPAERETRARRCEDILSIQAHGLARRVRHTRAKSLVVGISGGLDSCLALLVAVRAMALLERPTTDITAVTMPCFGTTARTKSNALTLCERLGVAVRTIDITQSVLRHFEDIGHDPGNHNVVFENAQARERTQVLMDLANAQGGLVVGTGDLSELALGWATYNGDHMSMYGVNASVPKTLIRHLVAYEAARAEDARLAEVLRDILDTPVSPELLPADGEEIAQKTEELVGPYLLHDFYLFYCIRRGYAPEKVFRIARQAFAGEYGAETLLYWLKNFYRRFFAQQFKRSCLPDGPKVGSVSLSPRGDWRMPSDAVAAVWLAEVDRIETQESENGGATGH